MRDQSSPAFWAKVEANLKKTKAAYKKNYLATHPEAREGARLYKNAWAKKQRLNPDYLLRDREIRAAAMCRYRAKMKARREAMLVQIRKGK